MYKNNNSGHFNGSWNPDNGPHGEPNEKSNAKMPTVIDSEWSIYILSGFVAYSLYTKYFKKKDYDGDGDKEGCPVSDEPLDFNK